MNISFDKAKEILGGFTAQAQDMLKDGSKVEAALEALEAKMKEIPTIGEGLSRLPLMISMIRASSFWANPKRQNTTTPIVNNNFFILF